MLKAVIFDMDDTLIDWSTHRQPWPEVDRTHLQGVFDHVTRTIHPLPDFEQFVEIHQAITNETWLEAGHTLEAPNLGRVMTQTLAQLGVRADQINIDDLLHAYDWAGFPGVGLFPEVPAVVESLRGHGLKLGIITNAYQPMWMRDRELAQMGLPPEHFTCRTSSADVGYLKPHPAVFRHTLEALDAAPEACVFVGDNPGADIVGAQRAGMRGVLRVGAVPPALDGVTPDASIRSLEELYPLLDGWYPGWRNGRQAE